VPAVFNQILGARTVFLAGGGISAEPKLAIQEPPQISSCAAAEAHWKSAEAIGSRAAFEDHLSRFATCSFAGLAKARVAALERDERARIDVVEERHKGQNTIFIGTNHGRIVIHLRPDLAPLHVERIKLLARTKFYDDVPFHRVIPGFMAQTGDPTGTGRGKSTYPDLPAEFSKVPLTRGVVGMARGPSPNSASAASPTPSAVGFYPRTETI
jgi:hypothetical protein